jgi:hypothetical protein
LKIHFKHRPWKFNVTYSAINNGMTSASSTYASSNTKRSISIWWESLPDTLLQIPIHFSILKSDSVKEIITAQFTETIEPVHVEKDLVNIIPKTTLYREEVVLPR